jgi:endonuclease/exonuclease/phosphatase family metal-dependent hydrolase
LAAVRPFLADVTVLQEVPDPGCQSREGRWNFWCGGLLGRGIALVLQQSRYLQARVIGQSRSSLLVSLGPPCQIQVLALWSCPQASGFQAYLNETRQVLRQHESQLRSAPTVVVGDFNSSSTWDAKARAFSHSDLVRWLEAEFGLRSAYHAHHAIRHGAELHPTFYQYRHEDKPHHLDYCFLPADWPVLSVWVGGHSDWSRLSDHTPLVVEAEVPTSRRPLAFVQANEAGSPYSQHGEAAARGFESLG